MITAPYNFVPLNKEVFYPPWSIDVSHDIPFADGESGEIDITITAKSPIFIRDHVNKEQFCQHNGEYYIPSSSVKGMVRNVLEIMSFGEMRVDQKKLSLPMSIRDMSNTKELVGVATGCGFLKQDDQGLWFIEDYGQPRTIEYYDQKKKTLTIGKDIYKFTTGKNDENMSAQEKYDLLGNKYFKIAIEKKFEDLYNRDGKKIGTKPVASLKEHGEQAYLICTGEITNKTHEFVFALSDKNSTPINNIEEAVKRFKTVYFESDSVDGNFWKKNYDPKIGIPVFYRQKDGKYDLGLTQLFKLLYPSTLKNAAQQVIKPNSLDLAHTIFGTEQEDIALKGRVSFSHFKADTQPPIFEKNLTMTLGGPKASFYPTYIKQNCQQNGKVHNDRYHTLMDNSEIAGWKRYPIHYNRPVVKSVSPSDTTTTFNPIGIYENNGEFQEFSFHGKMRYHNLKPQELGALLSALSFHDNQETFYHNIGLAKAYGFGKIALTVNTDKHQTALQAFEATMSLWSKEKLQKEWIETEQIKELFAMHYKETNIDEKLKYLILNPDSRINQFAEIKKGRECLPKFSTLSNFSALPQTLLNPEYLEQIKKIAQEKALTKKENEDIDKAFSSDDVQFIKNIIAKYAENERIDELQSKLEALEESKQQNKFAELDLDVKKKWEGIHDPKYRAKLKTALKDFIKKWEDPKNNKGSSFVLDLVEQAKEEEKKTK